MGPKLDDFEVLSTIGSGSHGTVRKVRRRQDGQILVWKELNYGSMSESEKQGLVTEVNLLRELRHPNVVKFLHHIVERKNTTLYILMEYCPGGDLKRLITKCRQTSTFLEEGFIWRVLKQVCEVLKVCHSRDLHGGRIILHRDIKPANVFLDAEGNVKLGDFGLARTLNSEASFATTFVGTPYYMSPEVISGQEYNEKSDMWSLGCLIYELCALHTPFEATTHRQLAAKIKEASYESIPMHYSSDLQNMLSLLLTYEDFLRPTALMIIHHSALKARTSTKDDEDDDPLCHSLNPSVLLNLRNKDKTSESMGSSKEMSEIQTLNESQAHKDSNSISTKCSVSNCTLGATNQCKNSDSSLQLPEDNHVSSMSATYNVSHQESKKSETVSNSNDEYEEQTFDDISKYYEKISENEMVLDDSTEHTYRIIKEAAKPVHMRSRSPGITELDLVKPDCACSGMSLTKWRERVLALREAEAAVRERELDVRERERDVVHREHRVATMEREARQHLVRAQIYLKQSRHRKNAATSPHRPPSDLDTTVSADIGDEGVHTVAKLDPLQIENPFLKMRGLQSQAEKRVSFEEGKTAKFKSNTLDNPKSRRKRGNIFGLVERNSENKKDSKEIATEVTEPKPRIPLKPLSTDNQAKQQKQKSKFVSPQNQAKPSTPCEDGLQQGRSSRSGTKVTPNSNAAPALQRRSRSSENLTRRFLESQKNKENIPSQGTKGKQVPEVKECLKTWRTSNRGLERLVKRDGSGKKVQKVPVMQFYNVV
ncbi:probable serine/threonine-protein kinase nek2 [Macrobrachium nipponense]|uniref:probable serine/threonine-protein kinase nek2 n=1 Tax=Macrobrachium nipponense TaxID=159736 RepID=UPI0030C8ACD0